MSCVWAEAASSMGRLGYRVAELTVAPEIVANAVFDPAGAVRSEAAILAAAMGSHGLVMLAAKLAADSALLRAVVGKEQLVDDLPMRQLISLEASLLTLPLTVARDPALAGRLVGQRAVALADAFVGYGAPFTTPLLELLAPSARFRFDAAAQRPLSVDPVLGFPLAALVPANEHQGGSVSISRYSPEWARQPPSSISSILSEVGDLENQPDASIAVQRVVGHDGLARYVVVLTFHAASCQHGRPRGSPWRGRCRSRCADELHDPPTGGARWVPRPRRRRGVAGRTQSGWHRRHGPGR
jgi:hypothetical protein